MVLAALFSTLGYQRVDIDRDGLPGFASCFLVELWRRPDGTVYVETHYRRLNEADFHRTTSSISGCQAECTLERFVARSRPYKADPDWNALCQTPLQDGSTSATSAARMSLLTPALILGLVGILRFFAALYWI